MGFIIFIIIFYNLFGKTNPKLHDKMKGRMPLLIMFFFVCQILQWSSGGVAAILGTILGLGIALSPFIFIGWVINKITGKNKRNKSEE